MLCHGRWFLFTDSDSESIQMENTANNGTIRKSRLPRLTTTKIETDYFPHKMRLNSGIFYKKIYELLFILENFQ